MRLQKLLIILSVCSLCACGKGFDDADPNIKFTDMQAKVTGVISGDDGFVDLTAKVAYDDTKAKVVFLGFAYKKAGEVDYKIERCLLAETMKANIKNLSEGEYEYFPCAKTNYQLDYFGEHKTFVVGKRVSVPHTESVSFEGLSARTHETSSLISSDGWAELSADARYGGSYEIIGYGFYVNGEKKEAGLDPAIKLTVENLKVGKYTYSAYAEFADEHISRSEDETFEIKGPATPDEVDFEGLKAVTAKASSPAASDGKVELSVDTRYGGQEEIVAYGFYVDGVQYKAGVNPSYSYTLTNLKVKTYQYYAYAEFKGGRMSVSSVESFEITSDSVAPVTSKHNWAELPVIVDANGDGRHDTDNTIYYSQHMCGGNEKNAQGTAVARNYTVCFSAEHHVPLWVAAPRHAMYEGSANRTDAYQADPNIPASLQYSSKSTGDGCNKGHMLGSAERTCSSGTNRQVFYYSNIAPQRSDTFNTGGGAWNNLEDFVDEQVCRDTLYIVTGTYFEAFSKNGASASPKKITFGGRSDVSFPTMFYYVLLRTKGGNTNKRVQDCSKSELQCAAFVMCHNMAKGHKPAASDMMSVSDLEKLTGFTYFTNVPNAPKDSYSASDWGL